MSAGYKWIPWVVPVPDRALSIVNLISGVSENFWRSDVDASAYDNVDVVISCSANIDPVTSGEALIPVDDQVVAVPGGIIFESYPPGEGFDEGMAEIKDYGMRVLELDQFVSILKAEARKKDREIALLKKALREGAFAIERRVKIRR